MKEYKVRKSMHYELERAEAFTLIPHPYQYTLYEDETPVALFRLGYKMFPDGKEAVAIEVIEVFEEGCGYGAIAVNEIFKFSEMDLIYGESIVSATRFWHAIGATKLDGTPLILNEKDPASQEYFILKQANFLTYFKGRDIIEEVTSNELHYGVRCFGVQTINTEG